MLLPLGHDAPAGRVKMAPSYSTPTVAEFADRWIKEYAGPPFHARKNQAHARSVFRYYLLPYLAETRLGEVEPRHLAAAQRAMFARGLAVATVKGALQSVWASMWLAARAEGMVTGYPHRELRWPKAQPEPDPFTEDERQAIVRHFDTRTAFGVYVGCIFLAGMRPSEAAGLRRGDVDLDNGWVTIRQAIASRETTPGKTRKSPRLIRVCDQLVRIVARSTPRWQDASVLLTRSRGGGPVDSQQWGGWHFKRACDALSLRYRGLYHGRHTYFSLALMEGANPVQLAEFGGTGVQTMMRYYWRWMGGVSDPVAAAKIAPAREARRKNEESDAHAREV